MATVDWFTAMSFVINPFLLGCVFVTWTGLHTVCETPVAADAGDFVLPV